MADMASQNRVSDLETQSKTISPSKASSPSPTAYSELPSLALPSKNPARESSHSEILGDVNTSIEGLRKMQGKVSDSITGAKSNRAGAEKELEETGIIGRMLGSRSALKEEIKLDTKYINDRSKQLTGIDGVLAQSEKASKTINQMLETSTTLREEGRIKEADELQKKAVDLAKDLEKSLKEINAASLRIGTNYQKALISHGEENQALLNRFDNTIETIKFIDKAGMVAIAGAATIATGGIAGVAIGTLAGTGYSLASNSGQGALHVAYGNKTSEEAISDATREIKQDIRTSFTTAASAGVGMAVGSAVKSIGAVQTMGIMSQAAVGGAAGGAAGGVSGSVIGTGFTAHDAIKDFNQNYGHLQGEEKAVAWEAHKKQYRLDTKTVARDIVISAGVGAVGGAIGGGSNIARQGASTLRQAGIVAAELGSDLTLGVSAAAVAASLDGRTLTNGDIAREVGNSLRASIIGEAQAGVKPTGGVSVGPKAPSTLDPSDELFHQTYAGGHPSVMDRNAGPRQNAHSDHAELELVGAGVGGFRPELGAAHDGDAYVPGGNRGGVGFVGDESPYGGNSFVGDTPVADVKNAVWTGSNKLEDRVAANRARKAAWEALTPEQQTKLAAEEAAKNQAKQRAEEAQKRAKQNEIESKFKDKTLTPEGQALYDRLRQGQLDDSVGTKAEVAFKNMLTRELNLKPETVEPKTEDPNQTPTTEDTSQKYLTFEDIFNKRKADIPPLANKNAPFGENVSGLEESVDVIFPYQGRLIPVEIKSNVQEAAKFINQNPKGRRNVAVLVGTPEDFTAMTKETFDRFLKESLEFGYAIAPGAVANYESGRGLPGNIDLGRFSQINFNVVDLRNTNLHIPSWYPENWSDEYRTSVVNQTARMYTEIEAQAARQSRRSNL